MLEKKESERFSAIFCLLGVTVTLYICLCNGGRKRLVKVAVAMLAVAMVAVIRRENYCVFLFLLLL